MEMTLKRQMEDMFLKLGVATMHSNGDYRNPIEVILELKELVDDLDDEKKNVIRKFLL